MNTVSSELKSANRHRAITLGYRKLRCVWIVLSVATGLLASPSLGWAQETVCARVKIEIKQQLTLERQAFDAEMKINNTTDTEVIENVAIEVKITDEAGTPVLATDNPNDLSAKFFVRLSNKQNIAAVDGTGTVNPKTTSVIDWLIIPAPGSAGISPVGKKYLVGATLRYKFGGEETVLNVAPDVITVKPLPLLTLDYFLTQDVWADDPMTPTIEPAEPFTLGVRVKNNGYATAKNLKIDSAQPKILENNQGLLINFLLTGSYVNDAPVQNTLLINFGDIAAGTSKMGRWNMETTLAGKFTEFNARFSHSDELGGSLTSILQATNSHFLIRDVRVDLPGRDYVRDFLARDGDVIRVYESDGLDSEVIDRSGLAMLTGGLVNSDPANFKLIFPATTGFVFVRLPDPFSSSKAIGRIVRSDGKTLLPENVWLSKTRNEQSKQWEYWINFFDVNTTGRYDTEFQAPPPLASPPVVQFIPDRVAKEGKQISFLVGASSWDGRAVTLSATPLPAGASFTVQAADPASPGMRRAVFDWTPAKGSAGNYPITYASNDGRLSAARSANIKVEVDTPPPGPGTPTIDSPLSGAQVISLKPSLSVQTSSNAQDPTTQVQFEVYADEANSQLVASAMVPKAASGAGDGSGSVAVLTLWQLQTDLLDNTRYWWRSRSFDGTLYSAWVNGRFFVNLFNDPPDSFNLTNPTPSAEVASLTPTLSWTNSVDKDGDAITYSVAIYKNAALTDLVTEAIDLAQDPTGSTSWVVSTPLTNHATYYWRVTAKDGLGAQTPTTARAFTINLGNTAPTAPVIVSPKVGGQSNSVNTVLSIQNSSDAEGDLITYVFEIDIVNTFDSPDKRSSGPVIQGISGSNWTSAPLLENKHYWWRVKAQDGRAESSWVVGDFLMNAVNDAPPAPTVKNPGNGAWTATQQPSLEANPVTDPEGEDVHYQFEVYKDAGLTQKVTESTVTNASAIMPIALADKSTYWWRVRAVDPHDAASPWSLPTVMYVSTAPYQAPNIALTTPASFVQPDVVTSTAGNRKRVTLRWEGTDPNIEPTVALYWSATNSGFTGNLIVDGLRQNAGTQSGSYVWDVTNLATGTYYVYAVIYDAKGVGKAYAPGALVIPNERQAGRILVAPGNILHTSENGDTAVAQIRLGKAPRSDVVVPISTSDSRLGVATPASLTFTPKNWSLPQLVTVTGRNDCAPDGDKAYQVLSGKAQSADPDYIGLSGTPINLTNWDNGDVRRTTNNPTVHICNLTVVSERQLTGGTWEYALRAELTNSGDAVSGVTAHLQVMSAAIRVFENGLVFGAVGRGDTAKTNGTVIVRSRFPIPAKVFKQATGFTWNVAVQP